MPIEIVLQAGTEVVQTAEIPAMIAEALFPEAPDEQRLVTKLTKTAKPLAEGKKEKWNGWPTALNGNDLKICQRCWIGAGLPPLALPVTEDKFRSYAEAVNEKGNHLDWMLTGVIMSPKAGQRSILEREHLQNIISAIRGDKLRVLDPMSRLPTNEEYVGSIVTVEELSRYVAQFNIDVRVDAVNGHGAGTDDGQSPATAAKVEDAPVPQVGEPPMRPGKNNREAVEAWVDWQARDKLEDGDTVSALAKKIYLIAERWGYQSERQKKGEKISVANIIRMIPAGLTGGRTKNTGKPKK